MANKKNIVIRGSAAGPKAAAKACRMDEFAEITMFQKGPDLSIKWQVRHIQKSHKPNKYTLYAIDEALNGNTQKVEDVNELFSSKSH